MYQLRVSEPDPNLTPLQRLATEDFLFLLVNNSAVDDLVKLHGVGTCSIRMKDHVLACKKLRGDGAPVALADRAWAWSTCLGVLGV